MTVFHILRSFIDYLQITEKETQKVGTHNNDTQKKGRYNAKLLGSGLPDCGGYGQLCDLLEEGVNVGREWRGECGATLLAVSIIPWLRNCFIAHIRLLNIWGARQDN